MKSFHMYIIAGLCIYICCLYYDSMYRACNTCCELPVSLQEAVLGHKTPSLDNCPIREGRGLLSAVVSRVVPTLWKRADKRRKACASNIQADADRCKQTQTDRQTVNLVEVTHSLDNNISAPKFIWLAQSKCWPRPID